MYQTMIVLQLKK